EAKGANMSGADFSGSRIARCADPSGANFRGASVHQTDCWRLEPGLIPLFAQNTPLRAPPRGGAFDFPRKLFPSILPGVPPLRLATACLSSRLTAPTLDELPPF
ncbi:MAG: pentapeptide repeat-containing protein, partial [Candidatus Koribacter versatilis]|nr:pentapeptide repeat-containing protein [Candidatus Koribacter versatilis]